MNHKPFKSKSIFQETTNTLKLLSDNNLLYCYNPPVLQTNKDEIIITWTSHFSGRVNCEHYFGSIEQYLTFIENNAYTCMLFDGSIIRAYYKFQNNGNEVLSNHSLLWWPSPYKFNMDEDAIDISVHERIKEYVFLPNLHENIKMRSPMRFDYDITSDSDTHPLSHAHLQNNDCRIFIDRPLCFNKFIRFIFENFYVEKYKLYDFWDDLEYLKVKNTKMPVLNDRAYISWS